MFNKSITDKLAYLTTLMFAQLYLIFMLDTVAHPQQKKMTSCRHIVALWARAFVLYVINYLLTYNYKLGFMKERIYGHRFQSQVPERPATWDQCVTKLSCPSDITVDWIVPISLYLSSPLSLASDRRVFQWLHLSRGWADRCALGGLLLPESALMTCCSTSDNCWQPCYNISALSTDSTICLLSAGTLYTAAVSLLAMHAENLPLS